jgi:hypothetical protein
MRDKPDATMPLSESRVQRSLAPHRLVVIVAWVVVTTVSVVMLSRGVRFDVDLEAPKLQGRG